MFTAPHTARRLQRSRADRQLTGLSGGIAAYLDADPTIVRVAWVLATLATFPVAPLAYVIMAALVPSAPAAAPAPVAGDTFAI